MILGQTQFNAYGVYNPFVPNTDIANGSGQVAREYFYYLNLATGELTNWQSTGWEYNRGHTEITFHLDPKVRWSDGRPFTSKDVKFTIELLQKNQALIGAGYNAILLAKSVATPDAHTVVVRLTEPNTRYHYDFINYGVSALFLAVPQHTWSGHDPTKFKNNPPVYSGPYKLKEANRTLQYFLWEKNPSYWAKDRLDPRPKYVAYLTAPQEMDAATLDFKDAKIDQGGIDYTHAQALIKGGEKNVQVTHMLDECVNAIIVNCDPSKGILADHRMRWVISSLIDRDYIAKNLWQGPKTMTAKYPWPDYPTMRKWESPEIAAKYPLTYDPSKAQKLLDEMGAHKSADGTRHWHGKPLSFTIAAPTDATQFDYQVADLLAKELRKVGIRANPKANAGPSYWTQDSTGDYDIRSEWGCCWPVDPYQSYVIADSKTYVPIGKNSPNATNGDYMRLKDPKFDKLVGELSKTDPNDPKARPLYDQVLDEWYRQMPMIPYLYSMDAVAANTTYWTGWPTNDNLYQEIWNWWGHFMFVIGQLQPTGKR